MQLRKSFAIRPDCDKLGVLHTIRKLQDPQKQLVFEGVHRIQALHAGPPDDSCVYFFSPA